MSIHIHMKVYLGAVECIYPYMAVISSEVSGCGARPSIYGNILVVRLVAVEHIHPYMAVY